jgi:quinol-cytochrome oxidoreductase complex cytochrome b subunit
MLAKIQIIILFTLPFLLIPILIKTKDTKNTLIKLKKIFVIQNLIFFLFYLFFQTILIYLSSENQRMYIDGIFFISCLIFYLFYSKKFIKLEKEQLFILNNGK